MSARGDDPKGAGGRRKPAKVVHAHDEFELDISVDTNIGALQPAELLPDLFAETLEESGEGEEATEVLTLPTEPPVPKKRSKTPTGEVPVSTGFQEEVLPVFVPMRSRTPNPAGVPTRVAPEPGKPASRSTPSPAKSPPPPVKSTPPPVRSTPPPARGARQDGSIPPPPAPFKAVVEDLSSGVFQRPGSAQPLDLALAGLSEPRSKPEPGPLPDSGEVSDPALDPLDIRQFEMSTSQPKKKAGSAQRTGTTDFRGEALRSGSAPMAQPRRVVRTVFTFGTRELLIMLLLLLLGAGLWVGWSIYQDYSRQLDLERVDQQRSRLDAAKDSAIDSQKVKPRERDIP